MADQYAPPKSAAEFMSDWYPLAEAHNTTGLEAREHCLPELAETDPDMALEILRNLAASKVFSAKEAAVIYSRPLFHTHPEQVTDLLVMVFQTDDPELQGTVLDTIDTLTSDPQNMNPAEAAELITAINTAGNATK